MYLGFVGALLLTLVTGFLAGKEYDNMIKRYNENVRRRREEERRIEENSRRRREQIAEQKKFEYMYSVKYDCPKSKGGF